MEEEKKLGSELRIAAMAGKNGVVASLVAQGVPVDAMDSTGWTALMLAIKYGQKSTVLLLLNLGADCDIPNENGRSVLKYAIDSRDPEIVQLLLEAGADVNPDLPLRDTPLYYAVESGNMEMVEILLKGGARVDFRGDNGRRVFAEAKSREKRNIAALLREYGASDPAEDTGSRWTITRPVKKEIRMRRNQSGPQIWCAYDVAVSSAPECDGIEVVLASDADAVSIKWFPHIRRGILKGLELQHEYGDEWVGIRIVVLEIQAHSIATTEHACEIYGQIIFSFLEYDVTRLPD